jgi:hypothetical protein
MRQELDFSKIPAIVAETKRSGVWICPTQALAETNAPDVRDDTLAKWPEVRYASANVLPKWKVQRTSHQGGDERVVNGTGGTLDALHHVIKALQAGGVGLLSGTDAGSVAFIPYLVPGFALYHELAALVVSGLTPYQALATSTRNVAVYYGTLNESGTVAVGKRADMVLLEANPLVDIRNTTRIAGVMHDGRWFDRKTLDRRLDGIVGKYEWH